MSSMRNAVQRRNHKERAQPLERQKWGLLEKSKDYKLRAADHKSKQARLKLLRQKATERNPDEFSFKMMSSSVDKHGRRTATQGSKQQLSEEVVKLLKTQDAGYIRTMLQMVRKEREDLEQKVMVEGRAEVKALKNDFAEKRTGHTVFVDDRNEQEDFDEESWFGQGKAVPQKQSTEWTNDDEDEEYMARPKKLSRKQQEAQKMKEKEKVAMERKRERAQERLATHLDAVKARERDLMTAEEELENQRARMNNSIGGVNKHGVKFKIRERKR